MSEQAAAAAATQRRVSIVGSTGSIGRQAIDVVRTDPESFQVVALGANRSVETLAAQACSLDPPPQVVAIAEKGLGGRLAELVPAAVEVLEGPEALAEVARIGDVVLNAVVGFAGLPVTLAALSTGRRLALANKESLIAGAPVVQARRATPGCELVPVDSEHGAIHQCLGPQSVAEINAGVASGRGPGVPSTVARLVVTASGGPFRGRSLAELEQVTVDDALAHPTWRMGPKITVDSSTLMNKGLEVIEAHELFGVPYEAIEVLVHPQSIVHSMVEFGDGSTIAQLSFPDMRLPIGYALSYPDRLTAPFGRLDWSQVSRLEFEAPDLAVFRCLRLAFEAGRAGGGAPAWLNAANEVAVAAFLEGRLPWLAIADVVSETLDAHDGMAIKDVEDVLGADAAARAKAYEVLARLGRSG